MNAVLRRRLEMAARVRDFLRAHRTELEGEATALARLEELMQRAQTLAAQQQSGLVATQSATAQRGQLRRELQTKLLSYLGALGVLAARDNAELAVQFRPPRTGASHQAFLTVARGMLEKAAAQRELLVSRGMAPGLLDDLAAALAEFEKTLEASRAGRRDHVGASTDLRAVGAEIRGQVRMLDGLVRYRFGDNAELMGAWGSARNVLGPFRSRGEPEAGEEQQAQAGPDAVASAA